MSLQELVQGNFKLRSELKQLKNELVTLRAVKQFEEGLEVARIKSAYESLEKEVVSLRIQQESQLHRQSQSFPVSLVNEEETAEQNVKKVVEMLSQQLSRELEKYASLEQKYFDLRKELSNQSVSYASTSVGSPFYKTCNFSIEAFPQVVLMAREREEEEDQDQLSPPISRDHDQHQLLLSSQYISPPQNGIRKRKKNNNISSKSVKRLSKIARFKHS